MMVAWARAVEKVPIFTIDPVYVVIDSGKLPSEFLVHGLFEIDRKRIGRSGNENKCPMLGEIESKNFLHRRCLKNH